MLFANTKLNILEIGWEYYKTEKKTESIRTQSHKACPHESGITMSPIYDPFAYIVKYIEQFYSVRKVNWWKEIKSKFSNLSLMNSKKENITETKKFESMLKMSIKSIQLSQLEKKGNSKKIDEDLLSKIIN